MVKASEYRKAFKDRPETAQIHQDGFDYRLERRHAEHHHSIDAFLWDTGSETDSDQADLPLPSHKYKHEKFNRAYQLRKSLEAQKKSPNVAGEDVRKSSTQKKISEEDLHLSLPSPTNSEEVPEDKKKLNGSCPIHKGTANGTRKNESSETKVTKERNIQTDKTRSKKPVTGVVTKMFIPKPRPVSAEVCRPLRQQARDDKPPFVTYGCMDDEKFTNVKKTHNVRASEDVYPSALRALKRRELSIKKKGEEEKAAPYNERRKRALFNDFDVKMKRETSQWDTEYRNHFVGYGETEYRRSLSARAPSRGGKANGAFFITM